MKRLQIEEFGDPRHVVRRVECAPPEPRSGELLVALEAAPINPSDLLLVRGWYGHRPALPAELGAEGVGRVVGVGEGVDPARLGERVVVVPTLRHGTWQDQVAVAAGDAVVVDGHADPAQLAMLGINPVTADLLLTSFVDLPAGAWVGQTGGSSAVGGYVAALARLAGLRTLSVVRRPEAVAAVASGSDAVVVSDATLGDQVGKALGDERIALLLDGVAGDVLTDLVPWMERGATLVSYGGMSGGMVSLRPADLIFRDIRVRGFWQKHWIDTAPRPQVVASYARLSALTARGALQAPVAATYPLDQHEAALAHAATAGRPGKVLFTW